jgi:hypothetical protein
MVLGKVLELVAVVIKGMKSRDEEQTAEKRWACGGTNPK